MGLHQFWDTLCFVPWENYISGTKTLSLLWKAHKSAGLSFGLDVSMFELQSRSYVHFWRNTAEKGMTLSLSVLSPAIGEIVQLFSFNKDGFVIK